MAMDLWLGPSISHRGAGRGAVLDRLQRRAGGALEAITAPATGLKQQVRNKFEVSSKRVFI